MLICASLILPIIFNLELSYFTSVFWESGIVPPKTKAFYHWVFGMYAAMATPWALFIVLVAWYPFKRKEKWSWYCLFSCISVWYIIDTVFSLHFDFI